MSPPNLIVHSDRFHWISWGNWGDLGHGSGHTLIKPNSTGIYLQALAATAQVPLFKVLDTHLLLNKENANINLCLLADTMSLSQYTPMWIKKMVLSRMSQYNTCLHDVVPRRWGDSLILSSRCLPLSYPHMESAPLKHCHSPASST